jgi:hypothetical protein
VIAGAFKKAGYDEMTITPRSGDFGRDVIAVKNGIGCVKIIGSVKAYAPKRCVGQDDVRALLGGGKKKGHDRVNCALQQKACTLSLNLPPYLYWF